MVGLSFLYETYFFVVFLLWHSIIAFVYFFYGLTSRYVFYKYRYGTRKHQSVINPLAVKFIDFELFTKTVLYTNRRVIVSDVHTPGRMFSRFSSDVTTGAIRFKRGRLQFKNENGRRMLVFLSKCQTAPKSSIHIVSKTIVVLQKPRNYFVVR